MIKCVTVCKYISENAYFYVNDKTNHCFLIDPGSEGKRLFEIAESNNWMIDKILITHGHFDHIGGINEIREIKDIPVYAYKESKLYLTNPEYNLSKQLPEQIIIDNVNYFNDGDIIKLDDDFYLKVISTPGHTLDSVIFVNDKDKVIFSGDTIFKNSIGNTSFPGGDYNTLIESIVNKILVMADDYKIYSGHSDVTTIKDERKYF